MRKIMPTIDRSLYWILIVMMAFMVIAVSWQVFTRYVLGASSPYTEELSTFMLVWITLLGSAYAIRQKAHLGIDFLTRKMLEENLKRSRYFAYASIIVFSLFVMILGGLFLVYLTYISKQFSAALQIPMAYIYLILPLSGILMVYYSIIAILDIKAGRDEFTDQDEQPTILIE